MRNLTVWTRRDPFATLDLFADFDTLVRHTFGPVSGRTTGFVPAAEVTRDSEDAVVRVELPGVDVDKDVTVEVEDGRLVVRGERRDERSEDKDGRTLRELRYGSFRRSFRLPTHVTAEAISASYDAGVLSVRVTGAYAGTQPRRIPVTAGTSTAPAIEG